LRSSHLIDRSKLPGWIEGDVMNGEFAQLFRFALLVVAGFVAIGGGVMIFVWLGKDEDKKKEREQARLDRERERLESEEG